MPRRGAVVLVLAVVAAVVVAVVIAAYRPTTRSSFANEPLPPEEPAACPRSAGLCVERTVTRVLDGDTLEAEGPLRIRLVLVDAPESHETGGPEATTFLTRLCLDTQALIDEDDYQIGADPYGRVLAVVYCSGTNANAAILGSGWAQTYYAYCSASEFGTQAWTGCASAPPSTPPPPPSPSCDPSYPDVCIPPPPPDLDCADISYRDFRVLPPDSHHFDGDGDGVGCETGSPSPVP